MADRVPVGGSGTPDGAERFADLAAGVRVCYRDEGDPAAPVVLLIGGLGEDLTQWTPGYVDGLLAAGYRVVRMDNRDSGRSSSGQGRPPALWRQLLGRPRSDAYDLADLAGDCLGLLTSLGVERAHLVGRSMGGMIAQTIAATAPDRVLTLTSVYSTTGARGVGQTAASSMLLLAAPPPAHRTDAVRAHLRMTRHVAGRRYPIDDAAEAALAAASWDRAQGDPAAGTARQIQAIAASGDRTPQLGRITAPTLVLHGDRDLLVHPSGGRATAAAVPGARHVVVPGVGHHLPEAFAEQFLGYLLPHLAAAHPSTPTRGER